MKKLRSIERCREASLELCQPEKNGLVRQCVGILSEGAVIHGYAFLTGMYNLINMRQLHIFSIKPKLDMRLFVDFCVFP